MASMRTTAREFAVAPLAAPTLWVLPALWLLLVTVAVATRPQALLHSAPGNPVPAWLVMIFGTALAVVGPGLLLHYRRIRVANGVLSVVAAGLFTHKVAVSELDLDKARIVDLDEHAELRPGVRLWGMGLPGFSAGHHLLRNRARAFCLLTRREKVLVLPRRDGRYLLLSPEQPRALLEHLAATGPGA